MSSDERWSAGEWDRERGKNVGKVVNKKRSMRAAESGGMKLLTDLQDGGGLDDD
jgi:hypothetical protein